MSSPPAPPPPYPTFFQEVTGFPPFPYQERLAAEHWPQLLDIPTGLGKTAAVVVAWLYRLLTTSPGGPGAPRRLVYCLPMRVLVEQTEEAARSWCERAARHFQDRDLVVPTAHRLMGGDLDESWERFPENPAVLVGTQDMLLSRALNRGYAMSRYRWPVHFGLLQADSLWVYDETQLMGVGVETGAQLEGLRQALGCWGGCASIWMSATLAGGQLETVDHPQPEQGWRRHALTERDHQDEKVAERWNARKVLARLPALTLSKSSESDYPEALAAQVADLHEARGGLTLVILNRVDRAREVYQVLLRRGRGEEDTALVHARFRPHDRGRQEEILTGSTGDRIVVATQAVEAGVDVSSRTLVTELAPWPSLVQRLGRLNRKGEQPDARAFWIDIETAKEEDPLALPYQVDEISRARELLAEVEARGGDAGPASLARIAHQPPPVIRPVLRRRDLLDLFDTTPDLAGNDLDVSRYVRDGDDTDVLFYWRGFEESAPPADEPKPRREELCRVSLRAARAFLDALAKQARRPAKAAAGRERFIPWVWDPLAKAWQRVERLRPGQTVLLHPGAGGYHPALGWTGEVAPKNPVEPVDPPPQEASRTWTGEEAFTDDGRSTGGRWILLPDHLEHVRAAAEELAAALDLPAAWRRALTAAARWHDVGKAHAAFQERFLRPGRSEPTLQPPGDGPWAKSALPHLPPAKDRPYFRHELASALAWRSAGPHDGGAERDLVAYLIAAHHGKVRLSIRSIPGEEEPEEEGRLFARGVWQDDELPAVELPGGEIAGPLTIDLSCLEMGEGSWREGTLALRDDPALGPFRLAFLEAVLRIADWRASAAEEVVEQEAAS